MSKSISEQLANSGQKGGIVAFLQNAYCGSEEDAKTLEAQFADPDPQRVKAMQLRRKWGLFEGANYTGLTILRIFGKETCYSIWWENATPRWGWQSTHKFPADLDHIQRILDEHKPALVLTFGKSAADAVEKVLTRNRESGDGSYRPCWISGPHPASRQPSKYKALAAMRDVVHDWQARTKEMANG